MAWEPIAIVASLWFAAGMTFANILHRRGHDGWHWMLVCAIAGPVAVLLVADHGRLRRRRRRPLSLTVHERAVIDDTFATRDLVHHDLRTPLLDRRPPA